MLLKNRSVRKFVRDIEKRIKSAEDKKVELNEGAPAKKPIQTGRITSVQLQKSRSFFHGAERALARGKTEEAEGLFIQALTVNPHANEIRAQLAKLYLTLGRDQKAEAMYKEVLQYCEDTSCYSNLGLAYYRQQKFALACEAYAAALERDQANPERLAALGRALFANNRFMEAAENLEKATARLSRNTELLRILAESYMQMGDTPSAEETYKKINKLEPYDEEVKEKLSALAGANV